MAYVKTVWVDGPAGGTPVNAVRLNNIEDGIEALDQGSGNWITRTFANNGASVASADKVFVDTTGGAFALVLPASPNDGDTVKFVDAKGNFATATFTIAVPAGVNLMGALNDTLDLVTNYDFVDMTYFATDNNWIVTSKP